VLLRAFGFESAYRSAGTFIVQQFKCRRFVTAMLSERAVLGPLCWCGPSANNKGIAPTKFQRTGDQSHQRNTRGAMFAHLVAHSNRNIIKLHKPQNYRAWAAAGKRQSPTSRHDKEDFLSKMLSLVLRSRWEKRKEDGIIFNHDHSFSCGTPTAEMKMTTNVGQKPKLLSHQRAKKWK